ncbi:hypothetical protein [Umezawaea sp. NPDC059074]|uniref:hypothetical protein n=1 Tax=Umezawaea sp. NPDC059074 TaxID=3346716 RepID=UPI0036C21C98
MTKQHVGHVELLRRLWENPISDLGDEDEERVEFLNQIAGAYGYVDLIVIDEGTYSLEPNAKEQLTVVLSGSYRGGV